MNSLNLTCDILCVYGVDLLLYEKALIWLGENSVRRLFFVEDDLNKVVSFSHPQVRVYSVETPLQLTAIAMDIGKQSVFLTLQIDNVSHSPFFPFFQKMLQDAHARADLRLNDVADYGLAATSHALENLENPFGRIEELRNAFQRIPAILVGGGPSLAKNGHLLKSFQNKGLLFAGGSALSMIPCKPHFGVCIDKDRPISSLSFPEIPLFFQARMHPGNGQIFKGPRWLVPDSHFDFINRLSKSSSRFESGWTVGNLMVSLALHLGCDPIVCVGMDFSYKDGKKYPGGENGDEIPLIPAVDCFGNTVLTQKDWLMAVQWMQDVQKCNPDTTFLNATEGGIPFFTPCSLLSLDWKEVSRKHLQLPQASAFEKIYARESWEKSLTQARKKIGTEEWEEDLIYQDLLVLLWQIWEPVFTRALGNIDVHRELFFDRVLEEHLSMII